MASFPWTQAVVVLIIIFNSQGFKMARRLSLVSVNSYGNTPILKIGEKLKNFLLSALLHKQYFKQTKATSSGAAKLPCLAKLHNQSEWYFESSTVTMPVVTNRFSNFADEKEQEMHIGFATDVKYVAHIGWYGPMNEFTSPQRNFKWDFKFDRCEEPFNRFKPWKGQTEKPMTLVQGSSSEFLSASSLLNSPDRRKYRLIKALLAPRHLVVLEFTF
ncbi:hypothetical protein NC653_024142 [Populus alba x Populus x berolinensis]|uniref:Uncharacterized protein n=1 Tax=Populus alba x Populus x berolinensis TaxID=444605 RepID=A0AAD6M8Q0_9ROSI|nr:hypothetical protein NC653_024142 [Populus alba x Populus x berolinensis]